MTVIGCDGLGYSGFDKIEFSTSVGVSADKEEREFPRKSKPGTKVCREKLRRERLNDSYCRFFDLSSVLEPGKLAKTDKQAILEDAIRVLTQLRNESQELRKTKEMLLEEIKNLKAEKNELHEEKLVLKADNERTEQQ